MSTTLLINGSPRGERSNSLALGKAFVQGISEAAGDEILQINLTEKQIAPCRGCLGCWGATPGRCVIRDDMDDILGKIRQADRIVACFPLYYFGLPGPVKQMLDRTLPLVMPYDGALNGLHVPRYDFSQKHFALVSTCGYGITGKLYDALKTEAGMIFGNGYTRVFCPQGEVLQLPSLGALWRQYLRKVTEAGRTFALEGKLENETEEALSAPLIPERAFQKIVEAHWAQFEHAWDKET